MSLFYVDETAISKCAGMPLTSGGTVGDPVDGGAGFQLDTAPIRPRDIRLTEFSGLVPDQPPDPRVAWVLGRAGADISSLQITVGGHPPVVASRQGEWFAASWPAASAPITIVGTDASGAEIAQYVADEADLRRHFFEAG